MCARSSNLEDVGKGVRVDKKGIGSGMGSGEAGEGL